jgi:CheY-like chemotaxis protein
MRRLTRENEYQILHDLHAFRIHEALLVSSLYDSFILNTDGLYEEHLRAEYEPVSSSLAPRIRHTNTGHDALAMLDRYRFDVLMTGLKLSDMSTRAFIQQVKELHPELPVILLCHATDDLERLGDGVQRELLENIFIWSGDSSLFFTIAKTIEDARNATRDTHGAQVRVMIVVEDSPRDWSFFLPVLYAEIFKQNRLLVSEGLNTVDRIIRMRARPKILLAKNYEEALWLFDTYREYTMGLISDIGFPMNGKRVGDAGFHLAGYIKAQDPHMPVVLWSDEEANAARAKKMGVSFISKGSNSFLKELRSCMLDYFGFGDFVFRTPEGREISRARSLRELGARIRTVPAESLEHHARNDHFMNWLFARGEFDLAARFKPVHVDDFNTIDGLRQFMVQSIADARRSHQIRTIPDFNTKSFDAGYSFVRLGTGSMGGKARGLAFIQSILMEHGLERQFKNVRIGVPRSLVLATEEFDRFVETQSLRERAIAATRDEDVRKMFLAQEISEELREKLAVFLSHVRQPLAVRSSSLFEDSQDQPFAGLYDTWMLANNDEDDDRRLEQLIAAIKLVFASTYFQGPKAYFRATNFRLGQEKMSIVVQELVGRTRENVFYPDIAGIAQSHNFYPFGHARAEDGVANLVVGLGTTVVDGGVSLRVCPRYPESLPQFGSATDMLRGTQKTLTALDLTQSVIDFDRAEPVEPLITLSLSDAERHGTLTHAASVFSPDDDRVYDGLGRSGPRLVTFANILKYEVMPLAPILDTLLKLGAKAFAGPIEMEFAVRLKERPDEAHEFFVLQMRPFLPKREFLDVDVGDLNEGNVIAASHASLGNGGIDSIRDIVYVRPNTFDRLRTREIADEVAALNARLGHVHRPYLLIGMGRWGTRDHSLGIPVVWENISAAEVIIEANLPDYAIEPSAGTHFFHNLTTCKKGYIHIDPARRGDRMRWDWLESQESAWEGTWIRHLQFAKPLDIRLDGRRGLAVIRGG